MKSMIKHFGIVALLLISSYSIKAQSPCENKYGPDSAETVKNLTLFGQYYQAKDYESAFPYWYYLFVNAPCIQKNITVNGPYIIKQQLLKPEYKARMTGLIDTIMLCHQMRIAMFGEEGFVKGKWAYDMSKLQPSKRGDALKMFAESVAMEGNNTDDAVPTWYLDAAVKEYEKKKLSFDSLLMVYDQMSEIINFNRQKDTASTKWKVAEENNNKLMLPYLDCDKLESIKRKELEANPKDVEKLKKILKLLEIRNCTDKDFYLDVSEALYKAEPSAEAAYALAKAFKGKGQLTKAFDYYEKSAEALASADDKAEAYYNLSYLSLTNKQLSNCRNYARKALAVNPNMGKAYILIGDAYYSSSAACTEDKLGGRSVFWAAADKYMKAKQVDPSLEETANEKINKSAQNFPDQETAFFNGITDGSSFSVGCWIGETTTVRTRK